MPWSLRPSTSVDDGVRARLRDDLSARIAPLVELLAPGEQIVVTLPTLRQVQVRPDSLMQPDEPFEWKPVFVRRSLGLEVVSACATRRFRAPADAVRAGGRRGGGRMGADRVAQVLLGAMARRLGSRVPCHGAGRGGELGHLALVVPRLERRSLHPPTSVGPTTSGPVRPAASSASRADARCGCRWPGSRPATGREGFGGFPDGAGVAVQRLSRGRPGRRNWPTWPWWPDCVRRRGRCRPGWWGCGPMPVPTGWPRSATSCWLRQPIGRSPPCGPWPTPLGPGRRAADR